MILKLLNIDRYIDKNKILEVKNANLPIGTKYDQFSLWSELIFGGVGTRERRNKFGFIDLKTNLIHPQCYNMIKTSSVNISKLLEKKLNFSIFDGKLKEDPRGETGLSFLIRNFDKIDFVKNAKKEKLKEAMYIEKNKSNILINKWPVLPAGIRDIDLTRKDSIRTVFSQSEINNFYKSLLFTINQFDIIKDDNELADQMLERVERNLLQIISWIKDNKMKGKTGIMRGSMMRKSLDFSTRIILGSSPNVKLGYIGLPWHTLLSIYEPLITHHVYFKDMNKDFIKLINTTRGDPEHNNIEFYKFTKIIQEFGKNPDLIDPILKDKLIPIITEVIKDGVVLVKRDPVQTRNSYFTATPIITEGRIAVLNSLDLVPLNGDSDGDTVSIIPLFTREAKEVARTKMNPAFTKSKYFSPITIIKKTYGLELDSVASWFSATKE